MGAITNELLAIARSGKFTAFLSGVEVTLFDGHRVLVRVKRSVRATRPVGLRFSQYSFVTEVSAGEFVGFGYGEAPTKMLAIQKSIAEGNLPVLKIVCWGCELQWLGCTSKCETCSAVGDRRADRA